MTRVLTAGGSGRLGTALVPFLRRAGHTVRISSRRPNPGNRPDVEWAQTDLTPGAALDAAVSGVDVIVHAASDPMHHQQVDVEGTRALLDAARQARVTHFVYISIVGVDVIRFGYYESKLAAEGLVEASGIPYSIQRLTQFHDFIALILATLHRSPIAVIPAGWQFQSLAITDAASAIAAAVENGPSGHRADVGGPQVLDMHTMAKAYRDARGLTRPAVTLPFPGGLSKGFRTGRNLVPQNPVGSITWVDWLATPGGHPDLSTAKPSPSAR